MREEAGHDWLDELAAAVADGRVLDWDSLESSAHDEDERSAIRRLRAIAAIGQAHTDLTFSDSASESLSARSLLQGAEDRSAPAVWGPLRILERVGRGRFGDVYRAWDPTLDREVALKLLRRREVGGINSEQAVIEEGRLMARVSHPNVVTIHGAQRIDGRTGLWMQFVEGHTLEAELKERGPFPAEEVVRVGIELCRALAAVHDAGLVHRDVKAQNVLRDRGGRSLLGDFGTGYELDDDGPGPTDIAGTPAYLAPEIFKGTAATAQSDIYSLGVLLFHLSTGSYPVTGRSISHIRTAHDQNSRVALETLRSDLPAPLAEAIARATDADPGRRFTSAAAMETALTAISHPHAAAKPVRSATGWLLAAVGSVALVGLSLWAVAGGKGGDDGGEMQITAAAAATNARVFRQIGGAELAGPGAPSPDGRLLSFPDKGELAFYEIATGKRWQVTGKESGDLPGYVFDSRFSGDGTRVFYLRFVKQANPDDPGIPEVRSIGTRGGRSRLIWRADDARSVNFYHWAGAGDFILAARWPDRGQGELLVIDADRGQIHATHTLPTAPSLTGASLSPDGRYVAFEQVDRSTGYRDIDLWQVGTDAVFPLIRDASSDGSPVWTPDGSYVLFVSDRSGSSGLWAQRVQDGRAIGPSTRLDPNIDAGWPMGGLTDTGSLFMRREIGTRAVFAVDVDPVTLRLLGEPRRVTSRPRSATGTSAWSPDGDYLAFFRREGERRSLVVHSMRDGREREYWRLGVAGLILPRWEPGGRSILFKANVDGNQGLHRLDLASGSITTVLKRAFNEYEPLPTPDVIVLSDPLKRQIVRVDLHTGREEVIHQLPRSRSLLDMGLSHGGDRLVFSTPNRDRGTEVHVLDLATPTRAREIYRAPPGAVAQAYAWSGDDREVIVERNVSADGITDKKSHLWAIDVATGEARPIGLTVERGLHKLQSSPDGRRLSYDEGFPYQEVWVLENAAALLPQ